MLKMWIAMVGLFLTVAAHAELNFLGEKEQPLFQDPNVVKMCGNNLRMTSMRGSIQPNLANLNEKTIVLSSESQADLEGQTNLNLTLPYVPKLAARLKKNPIVKVIFMVVPTGTKAAEMTVCLIDGKPFDEWMN